MEINYDNIELSQLDRFWAAKCPCVVKFCDVSTHRTAFSGEANYAFDIELWKQPYADRLKRIAKTLWECQGNDFYMNEYPNEFSCACLYMDFDTNIPESVMDSVKMAIDAITPGITFRQLRNNETNKVHLLTNIRTSSKEVRKGLLLYLRDEYLPDFIESMPLEEFQKAMDVGACGIRSAYSIKIKGKGKECYIDSRSYYTNETLPLRENLTAQTIQDVVWEYSMYNLTNSVDLPNEYYTFATEFYCNDIAKTVVNTNKRYENNEYNAAKNTILVNNEEQIVNQQLIDSLVKSLSDEWKSASRWFLLLTTLKHITCIYPSFNAHYFLHEFSVGDIAYDMRNNNAKWESTKANKKFAGGALTLLRDISTKREPLHKQFKADIPPIFSYASKLQYSDWDKIPAKLEEIKRYIYSTFAYIDEGGHSYWVTKNFINDEISYCFVKVKSNNEKNFNTITWNLGERKVTKKGKEEKSAHLVKLKDLLYRYRAEIKYSSVNFIPQMQYKAITGVFNLFSGFKHTPGAYNEALFEPIRKHIWEVYASKNEEYYDYFIKWLAHLIQKPSQRLNVAIILKSRQGAGKNIIMEFIMKEVIGKKYCLYVDKIDDLFSKFNSRLANKILTLCDETRTTEKGRFEISDRLKAQITRTEMSVERKGFDAIDMSDYNNYVFLTNRDCPVPIESDDRRWFALELDNKYCDNKEYFQNLSEAMTPLAAEHMFMWLASIDLTGFPSRIPNTAAKTAMKLENIPYAIRMLIDFVRGEIDADIYPLPEDECLNISVDVLFGLYQHWCNTNQIQMNINKLNYSKLINKILPTKQIKLNGKNVRGWSNLPLNTLRVAIREHIKEPTLELDFPIDNEL